MANGIIDDAMLNIYDKAGNKKLITPYSEENLKKYEGIWGKVFKISLEQVCSEDQSLNSCWTNLDPVMQAATKSIASLRTEYERFLNNDESLDASQKKNKIDSCFRKFKKVFIDNLEKELGYTLPGHTRNVLAHYYATTENTDDWNETIFILEIIKELF